MSDEEGIADVMNVEILEDTMEIRLKIPLSTNFTDSDSNIEDGDEENGSSPLPRSCKKRVSKPDLEKPLKCDICWKRFSRSSSLMGHQLKVHEGRSPHVCDVCGKTFTEANTVKKHKQIFHSGKTREKKVFKCNHCDRTFTKRGYLRNHMLSHGEKPYQCDQCDKGFVLPLALSSHKKAVHDREFAHQCEQCEKGYSTAGHLKRHKELEHSGRWPHHCDMCAQRFLSDYNLKKHKKIHHDPTSLQCDICGKKFTAAKTVKLHKQIVHEKLRPHQCNTCGQSFSMSGDLNKHKKSAHEGLLPYPCSLCGRTFSERNGLKRHERVHRENGASSDDKKNALEGGSHNCSHCDKSYSSPLHLKRHIQSSHVMPGIPSQDIVSFTDTGPATRDVPRYEVQHHEAQVQIQMYEPQLAPPDLQVYHYQQPHGWENYFTFVMP